MLRRSQSTFWNSWLQQRATLSMLAGGSEIDALNFTSTQMPFSPISREDEMSSYACMVTVLDPNKSRFFTNVSSIHD